MYCVSPPTCLGRGGCGQERAVLADALCRECYFSNLKERMSTLDDREDTFRKLRKTCGKARHIYKQYARLALCLKFMTQYQHRRYINQTDAIWRARRRGKRMSKIVRKCEQLMDKCKVPADMYMFADDDEEIVYLSEVESEPEASFTDSEEEEEEE